MQSGGMNPPSTMSGMGSYNQMGQSPSVGPGGGGPFMQRMPTPQQQQRFQQLRQQQILQMQQKHQMQAQQSTQPTAALLAQLRQVPNQAQPPMGPNYNQYQPNY